MGHTNNNNFMSDDVRVEAMQKVTGKAKYSAEYMVEGLCHIALVTSSIASGSIVDIQTDDAKAADGVLDILSHKNRPLIPAFKDEESIAKSRYSLPVFHTDQVYFKGQPVAAVIAESLEEAVYAASLVSVRYNETKANVDFKSLHPSTPTKTTSPDRGKAEEWKSAKHQVTAEYTIAQEVHNPMEMHATIAEWKGNGAIKLYDKSQGVNSVQRTISGLFSIPKENVEVISEFVGGGFGAALLVWPNTLIAIMAAKISNRPAKIMLTRPQMFTLVGHRPESWQSISLGADQDGKFLGVKHHAKYAISKYGGFRESITRISKILYNIPNVNTEEAQIQINVGQPTWMRGPGDCTGAFALESIIDELCHKAGKDPAEIRLQNLALSTDPESGKPWSTNYLGECVEKGKTMIGWENRKPQPKLNIVGDAYIGYGMGLGMWFAGVSPTEAAMKLSKDGSLSVEMAMTDIGTGTGTAMQNIASEQLGISKDKISIKLGNSNLPPSPSQGGSRGLSSLSGAVSKAGEELQKKVIELASAIKPIYLKADVKDLTLTDTGIVLKSTNDSEISYATLLEKHNLEKIEVQAQSVASEDSKKYSFCSGAAHFVKVSVHRVTGKVKMEDMVCVVDAGKIINKLAAANQVSGAAVGGIGMAMQEEQKYDKNYNSPVGNDFAGYHFAVNADAPIIKVEFINKPDLNLNQTGSKGVGEVGIIGCAAAIANAIFNATGKRLRNLPMTPEKILLSTSEL